MTDLYSKGKKMLVQKIFFSVAALFGLISVVAGAYASHGLEAVLSDDMLEVFEIGVRYQMYHALALVAVVWTLDKWPGKLPVIAGFCFILGTIFFTGTLYLWCLSGTKYFGPLTPIGGGILMLGWLSLVLAAWVGRRGV